MMRAGLLAALCSVFFAILPAHAEIARVAPDPEVLAQLAQGSGEFATFRDAKDRIYWIQSADGRFLNLQYDIEGRVSRVVTQNGNEWQMHFAGNSPVVASITVNGRPFGHPKAWQPGMTFLKAGDINTNGVISPDIDDDIQNARAIIKALAEDYVRNDRWTQLPHMGLDDAISSFANWLQIGSAIGGIAGAVLEALAGGSLEAVLLEAGLGGIVGAAFVVSLGAGWVVGTFVYDTAGNFLWVKFSP